MTDELKLVFPAQEHIKEAWAYRQAYLDAGEPAIHGSGGLIHADAYEAWLRKITLARTAGIRDWVDCSTYFAFVGERIVGTIQIRHELNEELFNTGGHIGYSVRPSDRRKGYATKMLNQALGRCRELGLQKALITCDQNNAPSARTIERAGGVLENEFVEQGGNVVKRYWIAL